MQQVRERVLALAGRTVASYRLERVLASGAADVVYLGRWVGKKPQPITRQGLPPLLLPEFALLDLVPLQEDRTNRAEALRGQLPRLQRFEHQSILPLLACGDDPVSGCIYAIYPYPSGGSLASRFASAKGKPLPFPEVTAYLREIAEALDSAHQQGYFHLHLSPDSIFLDANGIAYVAGIGLAQILGLQDSIAEGSLYAAPEQIIHDPSLPTTDIYSLGMVLYQMIAGRTAFDSTRQQLQAPPPPSQYRADLAAQVESVVLRAMSADPAQRYSTAGQLSQDFALAIKNSESRQALGIQQDAAMLGIQQDAAMLGIQQDAAMLGEQKSQDSGKRKHRNARKSAEKEAVALPTAPAPQAVAAPSKAPASKSKSFVYSSPLPTGNTLYPPRPQPQWELPPQLADQLAPTQEFVLGAGAKGVTATAKAGRKRAQRPWGIILVSFLIAVVCVAILAVLAYPSLNRQIPVPVLPGHNTSASSTIGSSSFSSNTGSTLYKTVTPGICDKVGAAWLANSESVQSCSSSAMLLNAATCQNCPLAVVTLGTLPGRAAYPTSYAAEVTVQALATDPTVSFGLKFRQQSMQDDGQQRGGYSFLVSQNGQWEFDKYAPDGSRLQLSRGKLAATLPPNSILGVVVDGSSYYFYVNGKKVAAESNSAYGDGYLCLVAAPSATILFSDFSLFRLR